MFEKLKKYIQKFKWFGYEWIPLCATHQGKDESCALCQLGLWGKHRKTYEERTQGKSTDAIPVGDYCYSFNGKNGIRKNGLPYMGVTYCPYYRNDRVFRGVPHPYCDFIEMGDIGEHRGQFKEMVKFFGSEDALFESDEFKLFLLFDGVKECGEKKPEDDGCCDPSQCIHKEWKKDESSIKNLDNQ
ncbi:MAG: hypothetical protein WC375_09865 [Methanomassiliicoccales archaeon]|jgi:hypothetical protein